MRVTKSFEEARLSWADALSVDCRRVRLSLCWNPESSCLQGPHVFGAQEADMAILSSTTVLHESSLSNLLKLLGHVRISASLLGA